MPTTARFLLAPALLLSVAAPTTAQQILRVGPNEAFAQITDALAVATAGDRVFVTATATTYQPFVLDRGVTIIGRPQPGVGFPRIPHFHVTGVPAGEQATVAGFAVFPALGTPCTTIANCAGSVLLESIDGSSELATPLTVTDCASVHVQFSSYDVLVDLSSLGGRPATDLTNSVVSLRSCTFRGEPDASTSAPDRSGPGIRVQASALYAVDTNILGGPTGSFTLPTRPGLEGTPTDSLIADCLVGQAPPSGFNLSNCTFSGGGPAISNRPQITDLLSAPFASLGGNLQLVPQGPPASPILLFAALGQGYVPIGGFDGALRLDPVTLTSLATLTVGGGNYSAPLPADPALDGLFLYFQGFGVTQGSLHFTAPFAIQLSL